jgi:thymidylate synthase (FAD)
LEHSYVTFAFLDVSPVLTHELVRHRAGLAFSQISLRFVRLTEIGFYMPQSFSKEFLLEMFRSIDEDTWLTLPHGMNDREIAAEDVADLIEAKVREFVQAAEELQRWFARFGALDHVGSFGLKKKFTSSMRRLAPYGLATGIIATANHRALRHMIAQRTARGAEEEIRLAFGQIAEMLAHRFPNIYQDMRGEVVDGLQEFTFENEKV